MEVRRAAAGDDQDIRRIGCVAEADPVIAMCQRRSKLSAVCVEPRQIGAGHHRRKSGQSVALASPVTFEQLHSLTEELAAAGIVARKIAGRTSIADRPDSSRKDSESLG